MMCCGWFAGLPAARRPSSSGSSSGRSRCSDPAPERPSRAGGVAQRHRGPGTRRKPLPTIFQGPKPDGQALPTIFQAPKPDGQALPTIFQAPKPDGQALPTIFQAPKPDGQALPTIFQAPKHDGQALPTIFQAPKHDGQRRSAIFQALGHPRQGVRERFGAAHTVSRDVAPTVPRCRTTLRVGILGATSPESHRSRHSGNRTFRKHSAKIVGLREGSRLVVIKLVVRVSICGRDAHAVAGARQTDRLLRQLQRTQSPRAHVGHVVHPL
jgi:hypothetical protein